MSNHSKYLQRFLDKAQQDEFFVAWTLEKYQAVHSLGKEDLTEFLACTPEALDRLVLCRQPDDEDPEFQAHVRRIAAFGPCNEDRLVQLMRDVAAFSSLQSEAGTETGSMLMAARDKKEASDNAEEEGPEYPEQETGV